MDIFSMYRNKLYREKTFEKPTETVKLDDITDEDTVLINTISPRVDIQHSITIADVNNPANSNVEKIRLMKNVILENGIREYARLSDAFKIVIDYSIYQDSRLIEHSCVVKPVTKEVNVVINKINQDNVLEYSLLRKFSQTLSFYPKTYSMGIAGHKVNEYKLAINEIRIHQYKLNGYQTNPSLYEFPHSPDSGLMSVDLSNSVVIDSSIDSNRKIRHIRLKDVPRKIDLNINIYTDFPVSVYTIDEITSLLTEEEEEDPPIGDDINTPEDEEEENNEGTEGDNEGELENETEEQDPPVINDDVQEEPENTNQENEN